MTIFHVLADLMDPENDQFVGYTAFLFFVFVIVMSIIIMNLLTGLAVDDIQSIAENAELKKLSMQVDPRDTRDSTFASTFTFLLRSS